MSTDDYPRYEHIDHVERLDYYNRGGYHPIQIGDRFRERYRIAHKLGHGSYSTTWLARDEQLSKYVAVKVGTASSNYKEVDILNRLNNHLARKNRLCRATIPCAFDRFDLHGPLPAGMMDDLTDQQLYDRYDPPEPEPGVREDGQPIIPSQGVPSHVYAPIWMGKPNNDISLAESKLLSPTSEQLSVQMRSRDSAHTPLTKSDHLKLFSEKSRPPSTWRCTSGLPLSHSSPLLVRLLSQPAVLLSV